MDRLDVPKVGDPLTVKWAQDVVDEIRRQELIPGNGLRKRQMSNGTMIEKDGSKKLNVTARISTFSNTTFLAKIVGGAPNGFFVVNLYPNGMNGQPYKVNNSTVSFYACATDMTVTGQNLIGRWIIVHFMPCGVIVGEDF